ncbi:glyoxalase/bleomycin resistance/extradiol dioxygenase family protein [Metabacillus malikii]|uniref:PhnB protein n=1 Tax=Metabacillus malikii TaxID=1504265 RepID=A0ABT9ZIH7_9BACI|nr:glyoxalase/bleomycin resistance/extradiol dioxygenase family protein [Metabacillus malikii]MDQ0232073.1 PhnB protein [Metabacillus malikii]
MKATVIPFIMSEDARTQADYYKQVFGGEILAESTFGQVEGTPEEAKDKIMFLSMTIAGSNTLNMADSFEPVSGNHIELSLSFEDEKEARHTFEALSNSGCTVKYPFTYQPWDAFFGEVIDKFGVTWQIVTQPAI